MAVKEIVLKGAGILKELIAAAAITPGHLVERTSSNTLRVHATAGAQTLAAFAVNNEVVGDSINDAYAASDTAHYEVLPPGCEVYAFLDIGENVAAGASLVSSGDGSLKAATTPSIISTNTGAVKDLDAAAATGVAVYAHIDRADGVAGTFAHLESVTAGNANSHFLIGAAGPLVRVHDDDAAATGGLQVYFDEDATDADSRFLINNTTTGTDLFVLSATGVMIRLKHNASANSVGVAVYFDDDAANAYERLLFVSPTNANGSYTTDDSLSLQANVGPQAVVAIAMEAVNNSAGSAHARIKVETV